MNIFQKNKLPFVLLEVAYHFKVFVMFYKK